MLLIPSTLFIITCLNSQFSFSLYSHQPTVRARNVAHMAMHCCAAAPASRRRPRLHDRSRLWGSVSTLFPTTVDLLRRVSEDTQFVQDRIDTAFRLMANAVTELNKNPINTDVANFHNTLFGQPFDVTKKGNVRTRFEDLSRISQHNNNDQTSSAQNIVDVRFYCTVKRIGKNKAGEYINKDRNVAYKKGELSKPGGRFGNCFDIKEPTIMITLTVPNGYSEIQICPWYLRSARGFKIRDLTDVPSSAFASLSKAVIPIAARIKYTPIDLFVLTDKIIIHELTHTPQAWPATKDLAPTPYGELTFPSQLIGLARRYLLTSMQASRTRRT